MIAGVGRGEALEAALSAHEGRLEGLTPAAGAALGLALGGALELPDESVIEIGIWLAGVSAAVLPR